MAKNKSSSRKIKQARKMKMKMRNQKSSAMKEDKGEV